MAYSDTSAPDADEMKLGDAELLSILKAEKLNSVGFENGTELEKKRRKALEYSKGEMNDVPSLPNRSKAVSTDVADAIETVLPDLIEIFTGGEDVASFDPQGQEDEEAAKLEMEYVQYVAFRKLNGWRLLYTAIKDALQVDTGIIETWWADEEKTDEQTFEGITAPQLMMLEQDGYEIVEKKSLGPAVDGIELFSVKAMMSYDAGCIKSANIDPNNLSVAPDTINIADATYCVVRSYPRAQSLIDQGFDPKLVAKLPDYPNKGDEQTELSRDLASENDATAGGASNKLLRTVQVLKHWVRIDANEDGKTELWRIQTDDQCSIILDKRQVNRIGLAVGTPFIQTHRFYGQSLADKLTEIQKIKTALVRMMLDSGYFAMNQRVEIAKDLASEETVDDVLRNEPGMPIRVQKPGAVTAIQAGQLGFDVQTALEYVSTMAEQRSGIVRNAQGLNPDTLHDTAKGAMALMSMAQKRVRMIARVLAETLVKDWYLNIHALSRTHNARREKIRLHGKAPVDIDPSTFGERADMVIEVGVGSGGREMELMVIEKMLGFQSQVIQMQGGLNGPIVTAPNGYELLKRFTERAGFKSPELFWTDPATAPPEDPKPDPEMLKAQADAQAAEQKAQAAMMKAQADAAKMELERQKMAMENEWVKLEAQKTVYEGRASQQEAELRAQETAARERNDQLKIEMDAQKAAADVQIRMAELEIKKAELALKERELGIKAQIESERMRHEAEMGAAEREARAKEPKPEKPKREKPDRNGEAVGKGLEALAAALSRPKMVARDKDGKVTGIE
jgi:hypothetical protein